MTIAKTVLRPEHPFNFHQRLFDAVYVDWDSVKLDPSVLDSGPEDIEESNLSPYLSGRSLKIPCRKRWRSRVVWETALMSSAFITRRRHRVSLTWRPVLSTPAGFPGCA